MPPARSATTKESLAQVPYPPPLLPFSILLAAFSGLEFCFTQQESQVVRRNLLFPEGCHKEHLSVLCVSQFLLFSQLLESHSMIASQSRSVLDCKFFCWICMDLHGYYFCIGLWRCFTKLWIQHCSTEMFTTGFFKLSSCTHGQLLDLAAMFLCLSFTLGSHELKFSEISFWQKRHFHKVAWTHQSLSWFAIKACKREW